jgi:IS1 family transposase
MNIVLNRSRIIITFVSSIRKNMNQLPLEKRKQIIHLLVEGNSLRATARICDVSRNTVTKLLIEVGQACMKFHDEKVRNVTSKKIQMDEIWSFVYAKQKNVPENKKDSAGDVWTWTAIDAETKLIVSYYVADRSAESAHTFIKDVAERLTGRVQLTTDGYQRYLEPVADIFQGNIDYAQLIKVYGVAKGEHATEQRYSPGECTGTKKNVVYGKPNPRDISTSFVERQNLTMRMHMRRFTRLTNAFSKKVENHVYAIALHFVYYNFCRIHQTLRVTPAMEAGLTKDIMEIEDIVKLLND